MKNKLILGAAFLLAAITAVSYTHLMIQAPTMVAGMFPPCNRLSMKGVISLNPVAMERILKPPVPA